MMRKLLALSNITWCSSSISYINCRWPQVFALAFRKRMGNQVECGRKRTSCRTFSIHTGIVMQRPIINKDMGNFSKAAVEKFTGDEDPTHHITYDMDNKETIAYGICKDEECNTTVKGRQNHCKVLMCDYFNLSKEEAEQVLAENATLWKTFLHESFPHLASLGLERSTFLTHPWLITVPSNEIESKIKEVSRFFPDLGNINTIAGMLKVPMCSAKFCKAVESWAKESAGMEHRSKFHFLSHILKVPVGKILNQIYSKPFLVTLPYAKVCSVTKMLLEAGISKEELLNDFWIFQHSEAFVRERIEITRQAQVPIKPWLIRAADCRFDAHVRKLLEEKVICDQYSDMKSFLMKRLECDSTTAELIMKAWPKLKAPSLPRLNRMLDYFLIEKGLEPKLLTTNIRVLTFKLERIRDRVEILESHGIDLRISLCVLGRSPERFRNYIERQKSCGAPVVVK